jgi:hypothetical protein
VSAIRAGTPNPIIVQWDYMCWVNLDFPPPRHPASTLDWVERHPLQGTNLIFGTHLYRNAGGGGAGSVHRSKAGRTNLWELADVRQGLELARLPHVVQRLNKPVLVTEIGVYMKGPPDDLSRELAWFDNTLRALDGWNIGYLDWAWRSDQQLEHGALHDGRPNRAGQRFLDALKRAP